MCQVSTSHESTEFLDNKQRGLTFAAPCVLLLTPETDVPIPSHHILPVFMNYFLNKNRSFKKSSSTLGHTHLTYHNVCRSV